MSSSGPPSGNGSSKSSSKTPPKSIWKTRKTSTHWGPIRSLLALTPLVLSPLLALKFHYALPEPLTDLTNPVTGQQQISEARILSFAKYLSEDIGYRTVGTYEHAIADAWMTREAESVKRRCEEVVKQLKEETGKDRNLECEFWRQEGNGNHRFDMMGKRLYKTYRNLTNIVIRISNGTPEGKEHALLVNSHLDSTLPSPGAADDAIAVGIMLDCIRVLVETPEWEPKHAVVFLFNNAEESLQDGSHLFSTQHPVASTVRAVINLEAAGTTGRELLFQATSEQMIEAYSHVPRPFGTVFANEIFTSGILLSDTDFRQFEYYLNVTGLDMAIVGNSYLYHMRKDLVSNIQPGVGQNMGENALALIHYLTTSPKSPIPELAMGYVKPKTVFFSYLGGFVIFSFEAAKKMYSALLAGTVGFLLVGGGVLGAGAATAVVGKGSAANAPWFTLLKDQGRGMLAVTAGIIGSNFAANLAALIMQRVLGKGMSWFSSVYSPLVLYAPPAIFGALLSQYLLAPIPERTVLSSMLLMQSSITLVLQLNGIGSAIIFFLSSFPLFLVMVGNYLLTGAGAGGATAGDKRVSLWVYALGQIVPLLTGTMILVSVLEVFVPLTGRIGAEAPSEHIIATIVSSIGSKSLPLVLPFAHRFGKEKLGKGVLLAGVITVAVMSVFSRREVFDDMHQKRMFVLHLENITSHEQHLHLSAADGAPGFEKLVHEIANQFAVASEQPPSLVVMDDHNAEWDSLYPFSAFLTPYQVALPVDPSYISPWASEEEGGMGGFTVKAVHDVRDLKEGTRSLTIRIDHPGLIWTVIAFDAHVLEWSLDDNPPDEYARHHIKEASFYGVDSYEVNLVIKDPPSSEGSESQPEGLKINFVGLEERGIWPAKKALLYAEQSDNVHDAGASGSSSNNNKGGAGHAVVIPKQGQVVNEGKKPRDGVALRFFEELDGWLEVRTGGTVDALLMGCVAGVTVV
ncbi:hypothetical protein BDN72DRAFT_846164 [Pluteus cervinus]|uniref:Uncharacterized protein n=1 Tax=Pluteus cervinus TaxID=181527 RepID=A0ACD3AHG4_9AGAR|nr:hypothetical protein BDN72DRAFT_846164 [Pluteus cervinus]